MVALGTDDKRGLGAASGLITDNNETGHCFTRTRESRGIEMRRSAWSWADVAI
jgi:hypothetical protein